MNDKFFDKEKALKIFKRFKDKAKKVVEDPEKVNKILRDAKETEMKAKGHFEEVIDDFHSMTSLVKDWISGSYRNIPKGSIIAIVGGIIYFVSPVDLLPDFILGVGYVDDVFVVATIIKQLKIDLQNYKSWKTRR